ncbi:MAG: hypothetical protein JSU57_03435 [Candidatus Heimdallarchaeota archaeon]|nr:MAG: hypothetical protein JSU57_03435 [Candidatus Heimdallarchaeota archaeon]
MSNKKKNLKQLSIHEYLDLGNHAKKWFLEFEVGDFGASITKLLELPQKIYDTRRKTFFLAFISSFFQRCEVSFILRKPNLFDSNFDRIDLALLGYWEKRQYAIPLWIMNDLLLGFEVISNEYFEILDSEPLTWFHGILSAKNQKNSSPITEANLVMLSDDFFQGQKIYFKLEGSTINVSRYFNELEFFDRIARAKIPEIDELDET